MARIEFDQSRLTTPLDKARAASVFCIGGGSIGSFFAMSCDMMGIRRIAVADMDSYSPTNPTKSFVISPDDIGRNKAHALTRKLRAFEPQGCFCGLNASICDLGPGMLQGFDYIVLCVDNYEAKLRANELWKQLPRRADGTWPRLILTGTSGEMAQAMLLDGEDICLECFLGRPEGAALRHECGIAFKKDIESGHVPTSGEAGARSALRAVELLRRDLLGDRSDNNKLVRDSGRTELEKTPVLRPPECPACDLSAPAQLRSIPGRTDRLSARELWDFISDDLGRTDFRILAGSPIILQEHCRSCGKPLELVGGAKRIREDSLLCPACTQAHLDIRSMPRSTSCSAITRSVLPALAGKSLYELGFDMGGYLPVQADGKLCHYVCAGDRALLETNIDEEW